MSGSRSVPSDTRCNKAATACGRSAGTRRVPSSRSTTRPAKSSGTRRSSSTSRDSTTRWSRPPTCYSTRKWTAGWSAGTPRPAMSCGASRWAPRARPARSRTRSTTSSTSRRRTWRAASRTPRAGTATPCGRSSSAARRSITPVRAPIRSTSRAAKRPPPRYPSQTGVGRWTTPPPASCRPTKSGWRARTATPTPLRTARRPHRWCRQCGRFRWARR